MRTGVLCPRCEEKVKKGEVSPSYMEIAKLLLELESKGFSALEEIMEGGVDERTFIEQLFWPSTLLTINKVWLPDDSVETKVILKGRRPWADVKKLAEVAKQLRGLSLRVEFVR
ncbi:hypothetical protein B6U66_00205 [Candidatus Bathyarchaeota archaeon ex4484_135]|nr:MAG: hypothetical protein B6U66_00205 [Candidatus Bathyarchaeota archaeon ex4484_135]